MKQILPILIFTFLTGISNASTISPEKASEIATSFFAKQPSTRSFDETNLKIAHKGMSQDGASPAFYVFDTDQERGFVIVAGTDAVSPILGYSDHGNFDYENIPDALNWLLETYKNDISKINNGTGVPEAVISTRATKNAISPLLTTEWSQGIPYNNDCPLIDGKRTFNGCTATAVAQVMYYHQWPDVGEGEHSYKYQELSLSQDFSKVRFDWGNMIANYDTMNYSQTQADAVSKLMLAIGIGTDMQYGVEESGAYVFLAKRFLVENMNYDAEMSYISRNQYSPQEFEDIIYKELSEKRPILCDGGGLVGKPHAFVCDGYDGEGMYHFNWGWGGSHDGYYTLINMHPTKEYEFEYDLRILKGIQKRTGEKKPISIDLKTIGDLLLNGPESFSLQNTYNYTARTIRIRVALQVTNNATGAKQYYKSSDYFSVLGAMINREFHDCHKIVDYLLDEYSISPGDYTINLVYQEEESQEWKEFRGYYGGRNSVALKVDNTGKKSYETDPIKSEVKVTNIILNGNKEGYIPGLGYEGDDNSLQITLINPSDEPKEINFYMEICEEGKDYGSSSRKYVYIDGLSEINLDINIGSKDLKAGKYHILCYDLRIDKNIGIQDFPFEILKNPEPNLTLEDYHWNYQEEEGIYMVHLGIQNNNSSVYQGDLKFKIGFEGKELLYKKHILIPANSLKSIDIPVDEGEVTNGEYKFNVYDKLDGLITSEPLIFDINKYIEREANKIFTFSYDSASLPQSYKTVSVGSEGENAIRIKNGAKYYIYDTISLSIPADQNIYEMEAEYPEKITSLYFSKTSLNNLKIYKGLTNLQELYISVNSFDAAIELPSNLDLSKININAEVSENITLEMTDDKRGVILDKKYSEANGYRIEWFEFELRDIDGKLTEFYNILDPEDYSFDATTGVCQFQRGLRMVGATIYKGFMWTRTEHVYLSENFEMPVFFEMVVDETKAKSHTVRLYKAHEINSSYCIDEGEIIESGAQPGWTQLELPVSDSGDRVRTFVLQSDQIDGIAQVDLSNLGLVSLKVVDGNPWVLEKIDLTGNPLDLEINLPDEEFLFLEVESEACDEITLSFGDKSNSVVLPEKYREENGYTIEWISDYPSKPEYETSTQVYYFPASVTQVKAKVSKGYMYAYTSTLDFSDFTAPDEGGNNNPGDDVSGDEDNTGGDVTGGDENPSENEPEEGDAPSEEEEPEGDPGQDNEDENGGIDSVYSPDVNFVVHKGSLEFQNVLGSDIAIYELSGKRILIKKAQNDIERVNLAPGLYVIGIDNDTYRKILIP